MQHEDDGDGQATQQELQVVVREAITKAIARVVVQRVFAEVAATVGAYLPEKLSPQVFGLRIASLQTEHGRVRKVDVLRSNLRRINIQVPEE